MKITIKGNKKSKKLVNMLSIFAVDMLRSYCKVASIFI
ncbi:hypothetical protein ML8HA_00502 [Lactococcus lactis]|nr:hypothetical protein [Lactococcus lactis]